MKRIILASLFSSFLVSQAAGAAPSLQQACVDTFIRPELDRIGQPDAHRVDEAFPAVLRLNNSIDAIRQNFVARGLNVDYRSDIDNKSINDRIQEAVDPFITEWQGVRNAEAARRKRHIYFVLGLLYGVWYKTSHVLTKPDTGLRKIWFTQPKIGSMVENVHIDYLLKIPTKSPYFPLQTLFFSAFLFLVYGNDFIENDFTRTIPTIENAFNQAIPAAENEFNQAIPAAENEFFRGIPAHIVEGVPAAMLGAYAGIFAVSAIWSLAHIGNAAQKSLAYIGNAAQNLWKFCRR